MNDGKSTDVAVERGTRFICRKYCQAARPTVGFVPQITSKETATSLRDVARHSIFEAAGNTIQNAPTWHVQRLAVAGNLRESRQQRGDVMTFLLDRWNGAGTPVSKTAPLGGCFAGGEGVRQT